MFLNPPKKSTTEENLSPPSYPPFPGNVLSEEERSFPTFPGSEITGENLSFPQLSSNKPRGVLRLPATEDGERPVTIQFRPTAASAGVLENEREQSNGAIIQRPMAMTIDATTSTMLMEDAVTSKGGFLRPGATIDAQDSAHTELQIGGGKGVLRPAISPVQKKAAGRDFFSRMSFRKEVPATPIKEKTVKSPKIPVVKNSDDEEYPPPPSEDYAPINSKFLLPETKTELMVSSSSSIPNHIYDNEETAEDEVIKNVAARRGWSTLPTNNPHCLHALLKVTNPWKHARNVTAMKNAQEVCSYLEDNIYCVPKLLKEANSFRFHKGDVCIVGVPRCGQTPILRILDCLHNEKVRTASMLVDSVFWVEGPFKNVPKSHRGCRLLKTHMPLANALKSDSGKEMEHKIILVLRHPLDLRLSWYRHVRQLFKKCTGHSFDGDLVLDSFAKVDIPIPNLPKVQHGAEPEHSVASGIKSFNFIPATNLLIVFYEELFNDPRKLVKKLAEFTNYMEETPKVKRDSLTEEELKRLKFLAAEKEKERDVLIDQIANAIIVDDRHPASKKRNGSSGQGAVCFSRPVLEEVDALWQKIVLPASKSVNQNHSSYEHLYHNITKQKYPLQEDKAPRSSFFSTNKPNEGEVAKPRKFGSLLQFLGVRNTEGGGAEKDGMKKEGESNVKEELLPRIVNCIDPDDPES